jgi:hypothetical protein
MFFTVIIITAAATNSVKNFLETVHRAAVVSTKWA